MLGGGKQVLPLFVYTSRKPISGYDVKRNLEMKNPAAEDKGCPARFSVVRVQALENEGVARNVNIHLRWEE